jgi:curved DNA-binding protein CbpA|tara:strand:+ start:8824 stop:9324 length:501 start_codon:yes stop_codon:yes gene_type:complete
MTNNEALIILGLTGTVSAKDIKLAYKRKAKQFHPDKNPAGAEMMKIINAAYAMVKNLGSATVEDDSDLSSYPEELAEAINAILGAEGLNIEVCGLWVWVSGETAAHKTILKASGFKWAAKKKMWFFRPPQAMSKNRSGQTWSMDKIRSSYGSDKGKSKQTLKISAA